MKGSHPPKYLLRFFRWFCHPDLQSYVEGDLIELFYLNQKKKGASYARWRFTWEVFKLLRPSLIKNMEGFQRLNQYGMFKNYVKTAVRSLKNNALFSIINISGLAISMSVGILMILLLSELYSFDKFHDQKERIYRVTSSSKIHEMELDLTSASHYIGEQLEAQVAGVDQVLIMRPGVDADLQTPRGPLNLTGYYATKNFFDVFSFKLIEGDPKTALMNPNSIVLTETMTDKLFPDSNPVGQVLVLESDGGWQKRTINGTITGVVADPPVNSHLQFESLVSISTYEQPATGNGWSPHYRTRQWAFQKSYVYVVLEEHAKKEDIEGAMADIMSSYNEAEENDILHLLQPLDEFVTSDVYRNRTGPSFPGKRMVIMLGLTLFVLLSACFNYTNLSLARALRRSKEVGIRKVNGASRFQLFLQFIVEAVILSFFALLLGLGIFALLRPGFLTLPNPSANGYAMFALTLAPIHFLFFMLFALLVGLLAGLLPATFLSKLKIDIVFRDASKVKAFSGLSLRHLLIIFQFVLSIGLIMSAVMVNKQYQYALSYDPGYETEGIFNVPIEGDYIDLLEAEYARIPSVVKTTKASIVLGYGSGEMGMAQSEGKQHTGMALINAIDENYFDMHGFELIAGNGFTTALPDGQEPQKVILNESFLKMLQIGSPEEAIGKHIFFRNARFQVIGVVKDFVTFSLNLSFSDAFGFVQHSKSGRYQARNLGVKIQSDDIYETVGLLQNVYRKLDPVHPFKGAFHSDVIAKSYEPEKTAFTIISFLAFLAISISTLGLLGMAVFTVETRMKEISIRKVLGARVKNLVLMLSKNFLLMIGLAALIAIPLARYIVNEMVLSDFLYRPEFNALDLLSGFLIILLIAILTIGWQIRKAAVQNPSDLLRDE